VTEHRAVKVVEAVLEGFALGAEGVRDATRVDLVVRRA
jgi:hypothetical protein